MPKLKNGEYVINLNEYKSGETNWIALYVNDDNVIYFDSSRVEHIPEEIQKFVGNRNITTNIFKVQAHNLVMCRYFCIGFIDFMLKKLLEYTNLFSPIDYEKNEKIILKYFQKIFKMK